MFFLSLLFCVFIYLTRVLGGNKISYMYSIYHLKREHHTFVDFIDLDGESPPDHLYELKPPGFLYFCAFHNSSCDLLAHVNCYAFISLGKLIQWNIIS